MEEEQECSSGRCEVVGLQSTLKCRVMVDCLGLGQAADLAPATNAELVSKKSGLHPNLFHSVREVGTLLDFAEIAEAEDLSVELSRERLLEGEP